MVETTVDSCKGSISNRLIEDENLEATIFLFGSGRILCFTNGNGSKIDDGWGIGKNSRYFS